MAANPQRQTILTPVGRLVAGSLYKPQTEDSEGRPLVVKEGPNKGQAAVRYFFALAIRKGGEQHWAQTPWGQLIYNTGTAAFPNGQTQSPTFAWKVIDGDSQIPNSKGVKPCDREGYPGHWVLSFSSGFAPKIYNADGTQQIVEPEAVKLGYYIQVHGSVAGNESMQKPGVYLNHNMVALAAYGPEIVIGPDAKSVGFGAGVQLPPGASAVPLGGGFNPAAPVQPTGLPPLPGAVPPAVALPIPSAGHALPQVPGMQMPAMPTAAPTQLPPQVPVQPHPQFLNVPGVPASGVPALPPTIAAPPMAAPVRQMTAKANGATYEQLIAAGWTDDLLRQHGMMV